MASSGCCVAKSAPWEPLAKSPRHELHASDEVIDIQPSQSSFVLLHRGRGTLANLRHPPEDCEPGGALERLGDEFHLPVPTDPRRWQTYWGVSQQEKDEANKRRRPRGFVRIQLLYLSGGHQVRGLSDFRAVAGSGSRRLSTQGHARADDCATEMRIKQRPPHHLIIPYSNPHK